MKGLLYKDWLMLKKYCRVYLLVLIVFLVVSVSAEESIFFSVYLMVLSSVLGVTLVSYDEKSGWERYCDTLPCPRELRVNEKYVFSLILMGGGLCCFDGEPGASYADYRIVWPGSISDAAECIHLRPFYGVNFFPCGLSMGR